MGETWYANQQDAANQQDPLDTLSFGYDGLGQMTSASDAMIAQGEAGESLGKRYTKQREGLYGSYSSAGPQRCLNSSRICSSSVRDPCWSHQAST